MFGFYLIHLPRSSRHACRMPIVFHPLSPKKFENIQSFLNFLLGRIVNYFNEEN